MLILPPTKEAQIGSKELKNRQNLNFERGLVPKESVPAQN
jgi:hypothetical protein